MIMDAYTEAHLFVAAIRVLQHLEGFPPTIEDVCAMLRVSVEAGHGVCRDLQKMKIIEIYTDPFSVKLAVADHLEIEKLPKQAVEENRLARELERFQAEKKAPRKRWQPSRRRWLKNARIFLPILRQNSRKKWKNRKRAEILCHCALCRPIDNWRRGERGSWHRRTGEDLFFRLWSFAPGACLDALVVPITYQRRSFTGAEPCKKNGYIFSMRWIRSRKV